MKILLIILSVIFGIIYISTNEIGKFIDDVNPHDQEMTNDDRNGRRTL